MIKAISAPINENNERHQCPQPLLFLLLIQSSPTPTGTLHCVPTPPSWDFSQLFIQALSCFSYIYPILCPHHPFYLSSGKFSTHKHAIIAPIFQIHSLDLTLQMSHFSFYLCSETWKWGLYSVSTSSHLSLFWTFSKKTFLPNPSYQGPMTFTCQIQGSIL